ncbi:MULTISPECIES: DUF6124 family protein [unclassified Pseudomonas]|uniref:DUF6124 family protein n=1 Tax=unclassified Pseudomonas TaxID=196821 RepID=UPI000A1F49C6|nr:MULTISPECIES: DUF6124 family protein [unclassified Pseudomonas]NKF28380.1 hypothetical protein [Pseudomonas sp. BG5]
MIKPSPNPPVIAPASITDPTSPYECPDSKRFNEAANRALDYHLGPISAHMMAAPYYPNRLYQANPASNNESLLADACETLGSANVMLNNLVDALQGPHRKTAQGIAQIVMLAELAVNKVLDNIVPTE